MATKTNKEIKPSASGQKPQVSSPEIPGIVPVAVIGIGCYFPGSSNLQGYWRDILAGRNMVTEVPSTHFLVEDLYDPDPFKPDKTYCKNGAFLSPIVFDPIEYGIPPSNIPATDTSQLLALVVAKQVLDDAFDGQFKDIDKSKMSIILGVAAGLELLGDMASRLGRPIWLKSLREEGVPEDEALKICDRIASHSVPWKESTFPGLLGNVVAGRVANKFNFGGTNCTSDAACASSFSALSQSLGELYLGQSDVVITGGVDTNNDSFLFVSFSKTPALSRTGDCRPFSEDSDGMVLGEGIGMVALKRLSDAERDGDKIYAVIKGIGSSSDGSGTSVYAPLSEGQAKALRKAYQMAGYGPDTVELVEAHGTGTYVGDEVEVKGLRTVFTETTRTDKQWCALGSVKSQIGHTKSTAAAASLIKTIMAVQHRILPPTIKIKKPDPKLKLETSPFYLNTRTRPWIKFNDYPRRASVSSFGFGGTNFHATLEEYNGPGKKAYRQRIVPDELILFSADNPDKLIDECKKSNTSLDVDGVLSFLARKTQVNFNVKQTCRLAIVASSGKDLELKLKQSVDIIQKKPGDDFSMPGGIYYSAKNIKPEPVAFLFPGQGSQYIDMGSDLYFNFKEFQDIWDEVNKILKKQDLNPAEVVFPKPVFSDDELKKQTETLTRTEWAQPAICATSIGMSRILKNLGIKPAFTGGHSLGELTALHEAGVFNLEGVISATRKRGELMAESSSVPGAMTAVTEPPEKIEKLLNDWKSRVIIANYNSPKQIVLSGAASDIDDIEKRLAKENIKTHRLNVSTAFHSSLMNDACQPFADFLKKIRIKSPVIPVFSNTVAKPYPGSPDDIRKLLAKQINNPVRFVEEIESMYENGARIFIEVGPGNVITNLVKKILGNKPHKSINLDVKNKHGITSLNQALGEIAVNGINIEFKKMWEDFELKKDPREKPKPKFSVMLQGCNYGRRYPPADGKLPLPNPPRAKQKENTSMTTNNQQQNASQKNSQNPEAVQPRQNIIKTSSNENYLHTPSNRHTAGQTAAGRPALQGNMNSWLSAFQEIQRQNAEAHSVFQKAISESHIAFLKTAESTNMALSAILTGQPIAVQPSQMPAAKIQMPDYLSSPEQNQQPVTSAVYQNIPVAPAVMRQQTGKTFIPQESSQNVILTVKTEHPHAPSQQMIPGNINFKEMLLNVVSDKTGYPKEILTVEMGLEADLGIDSIKRVEILSAIKDQNPWLPEVDPGEMANITTLGDVLTFIEKFSGNLRKEPAAAQISIPVVNIPQDLDFKDMLLNIVSDKTGYPKEILTFDMGLEADLGIDSIKRVEILSAVKDQNPWLPEVDPGEMANIITLGDVLTFIEKFSSNLTKEDSSSPSPGIHQTAVPLMSAVQPAVSNNPASTGVPQNIDYKDILLNIVSDKTGYPKEILTVEMGLEADLGIDSIKRVEILSAVKDQYPWLPEVDPGEMANIVTLGDVLSFIEKFTGDVKKNTSAVELSTAAAGRTENITAVKKQVVDSYPAGMGRYILKERPAPHSGFAMDGFTAGSIIAVTDDGTGVAENLVDLLNDQGMKASVAADIPENPDIMIFLGGLKEIHDEDSAIAVNREAFLTANRIAKHFAKSGGVFITAQDTGGDFGLSGKAGSRVWLSGLTGLIKTSAMEWPKAAVKAIDIERGKRPPEEIAQAIVEEIFTGGPEIEVGLHADGSRFHLESLPGNITTLSSKINGNSVIIASGGARGVTSATLIELAVAYHPKIVLLGRTQLTDDPPCCVNAETDGEIKKALLEEAKSKGAAVKPAELGAQSRQILACREITAALKAMNNAGSEARYLVTDVQNSGSLNASLDTIRNEWGPITGIIHGAGVLNDKFIADKTLEQFDPVFNTKVGGLRALLSATEKDPIDLICLFSSVAARYGNMGQCDYAMSNEILNKVADMEAVRRKGRCVVKSINWGPWDGGMVSPLLKNHFKQMGIPLIPLDFGARRLVEEVTESDPENIEIVIGPTPPRPSLINRMMNPEPDFNIIINKNSYPFIDSHRIDNAPVIPVVMVLEWFSRAAQICCPDMAIKSCRNLKVLKGIRLQSYETGETYKIKCRQRIEAGSAELNMELIGTQIPPHYTAVFDMIAGNRGNGKAHAGINLSELLKWTIKPASIYKEHLFHGPDFQVIKTLEGVSPTSAVALLNGIDKMKWPGTIWKTDAAAIDGGLQLAILWGIQQTGKKSLPTKIGSYSNYKDGLTTGLIRCELQGKIDGVRSVSDISFYDKDDNLISELRDVEMHMLSGKK